MNYEEAFDRLLKPVNKDEKIIGHRLKLRRSGWWVRRVQHGLEIVYEFSGDVTTPDVTPAKGGSIVLRRFHTDIIAWSNDGHVRLNLGDWLKRGAERNILNDHLPRNWRLTQHCIRFSSRSAVYVYILVVGGGAAHSYEDICWMPFQNDIVFTAVGPIVADNLQTSVSQTNALKFVKDLEDYADVYVDALLRGEISELPAGFEATAVRKGLELLVEERSMTSTLLLYLIADRKLDRYKVAVGKYFKERYDITGPLKTQKLQVKQLSHQMKTGEEHTGRILTRAQLRRPLKLAIVRGVLEQLGFQTHCT